MTRSSTAAVPGAARLRRRPMPTWIPPMLATLSEELPVGGKWLYEPKLDGVRVLIYASRGSVRMYSRNRKPLNDAYPELVEALSAQVRGNAVLDSEVVAFDPTRGVSSFARLQQRMQLRDPVRARRSLVDVHLYLFDCMYYEGIDLTGLELLERKSVLKDIVTFDDVLRLTPFQHKGAATMLRKACSRGEEGIMAKQADSQYLSARTTEWIKIKCLRRQELVIGGYTAPQGSRERLGALLVGYFDTAPATGPVLRYAGKVGTGYDRKTLELLYQQLTPIHRSTSPFTAGPRPSQDIQWVHPRLVAEVGFSEWTSAGMLRHPRFIGLRDDKPATEVRRES